MQGMSLDNMPKWAALFFFIKHLIHLYFQMRNSDYELAVIISPKRIGERFFLLYKKDEAGFNKVLKGVCNISFWVWIGLGLSFLIVSILK